jgi:hypothetical protein
MDRHDRDIYFKLIPPYHRNSKEVEIWRHLSSDTQRKDTRNHTLPLLDVLEVGEWFLLVTPSWACDAEDSHRTHIGELLDMGLQLFEVILVPITNYMVSYSFFLGSRLYA